MTPRDLKQPGDVMGGAKCTARTARAKTPLPYTTSPPRQGHIIWLSKHLPSKAGNFPYKGNREGYPS